MLGGFVPRRRKNNEEKGKAMLLLAEQYFTGEHDHVTFFPFGYVLLKEVEIFKSS